MSRYTGMNSETPEAAEKVLLRVLLKDAANRVAECRRRVNRLTDLVRELQRAGREASSADLAELAQSEASLAHCVAVRDRLRAELSDLCRESSGRPQHSPPHTADPSAVQ